MLGPFATAALRAVLHCHSPGVATVARRHCRTPPAHRCPRQRRQQQRQRQRVTESCSPLANVLCLALTFSHLSVFVTLSGDRLWSDVHGCTWQPHCQCVLLLSTSPLACPMLTHRMGPIKWYRYNYQFFHTPPLFHQKSRHHPIRRSGEAMLVSSKDIHLSKHAKISGIHCTLWPQCTNVTDRRTDRWTDRRTLTS